MFDTAILVVRTEHNVDRKHKKEADYAVESEHPFPEESLFSVYQFRIFYVNAMKQ